MLLKEAQMLFVFRHEIVDWAEHKEGDNPVQCRTTLEGSK